MRLALIIFLTALPAAFPAGAWDFKPTPLCTVKHATPDVDLVMTYDHASGLYALALTTGKGWPSARIFSIRFEGPRGLVISTDRQVVSNTGRTITASDKGFGNVLNGLEFNETATAVLGDLAHAIPLAGAAPEIQKFRDCTRAQLS